MQATQGFTSPIIRQIFNVSNTHLYRTPEISCSSLEYVMWTKLVIQVIYVSAAVRKRCRTHSVIGSLRL